LTTLCHLAEKKWALYAFLMFMITIPMLFIEDFKKFKWVNMGSLFFQVILMATSIFILYTEDWTKMTAIYDPVSQNTFIFSILTSQKPRIMFSMDRFLKLYGITCFGLESVPLMFPIMGKMRRKADFNKYFFSVTAVVTVMSCAASLLIYSVMGSNVKYIYLVSLIGNFRIIRVLLGIYSFILFLNMAYIFYPAY
jgi:hypothetical protein